MLDAAFLCGQVSRQIAARSASVLCKTRCQALAGCATLLPALTLTQVFSYQLTQTSIGETTLQSGSILLGYPRSNQTSEKSPIGMSAVCRQVGSLRHYYANSQIHKPFSQENEPAHLHHIVSCMEARTPGAAWHICAAWSGMRET